MKKKQSILLLLQLLFSCNILALYIEYNVVYTQDLFYNTFQGIISENSIIDFINQNLRARWISLLINGIIIPLISILYYSTCIYIVFMLAGGKTKFSEIFESTIIAEFVFVLKIVVNIIWRSRIHHAETLYDLAITPISAATFLDIDFMNRDNLWLLIPLNSLNFFVLSNLAILTIMLSMLSRQKISVILEPTTLGYFLGLILYIVTSMFLTLSIQ
jgi:hypothetical protein